jgi:hypothetical protein
MKYAKWIFVVMLVLVPAIAAAQMPGTERITARVPFTFVVGDHVIPLGDCIIQRADRLGNALVIRSPGAKVNIFVTASVKEDKKISGNYTLLFHKYGMRFYLAAVKVENSPAVYWVTPSSYEKEIFAENTPATEETLLASSR